MASRNVRGVLAAAASVAAAVAVAAPGPYRGAVSFETEVRPLLQRRCLGCHGVGARLAGLDLRTRDSALKGGGRGAAVAPGKAAASLLFQLVAGARAPLMPPGGRLPPAEIDTLRRWIDGGAPWRGGAVDAARPQVWWAFRPVSLPAVPHPRDATWVRNPLDAFVLWKLEAKGLRPSPPAPRRTLIRRAYLDVTGLPPSPEEVRAFEEDRRPDAWERVVDRLLASPHYGERWGRHWLDLVRYADSSGFEGDKDRPNAWRYRDYVIGVFRRDVPYDRFIREQLAGDELRPGDRDATIATGYLACGPEDFAMAKLPQTRADELDDLVTTTGTVFLGLTVGCARCHDHKYDPVTQADYYRLAALFAPTERRDVEIPTPEERREVEAHNAGVGREAAPLLAELQALRAKGAAAAAAMGAPNAPDAKIKECLGAPDRARWAEVEKLLAAVQAKKRDLPKAMAVTDKSSQWPAVRLLIRGDVNHPGPVVAPGFILALPGGGAEVGPEAATAATTGRRRALAEWIASPANPLTARVWMNRVWRQRFGRGIVDTPSNFGLKGDLPSHPELLDWLAARFMSGGWRLKPMHRLMLLSSTYRQASAARPDGLAHDPENRLLWRMPLRRLEAEAIRDALLTVAGSLNCEMGGPPVYPPVDASLRADTFQGVNWPEGEDSPRTWRRSVYVKVKRSLIFPQLEVFDCPEITASVPQRNVTSTPGQALTMLNDPLVLRQAALFAERVRREAGAEPRRQVERAYRLAFCRPPTARESAVALRFLAGSPAPGGSRLAEFCHALVNLSEFIYVR